MLVLHFRNVHEKHACDRNIDKSGIYCSVCRLLFSSVLLLLMVFVVMTTMMGWNSLLLTDSDPGKVVVTTVGRCNNIRVCVYVLLTWPWGVSLCLTCYMWCLCLSCSLSCSRWTSVFQRTGCGWTGTGGTYQSSTWTDSLLWNIEWTFLCWTDCCGTLRHNRHDLVIINVQNVNITKQTINESTSSFKKFSQCDVGCKK